MNTQDIPIPTRIPLVSLIIHPLAQRPYHSEGILVVTITGSRPLRTQAIRFTKTPILANMRLAAAAAVKEYPLIPDIPGQLGYQKIIPTALLIVYRVRLARQVIPKVITSTRLIRQAVWLVNTRLESRKTTRWTWKEATSITVSIRFRPRRVIREKTLGTWAIIVTYRHS